MVKHKDEIELEYERAIRNARDDDEAYELAIGLAQYQEFYKDSAKP